MRNSVKNSIENDIHTLYLVDGIIHAAYTPKSHITLEKAKQTVKDRIEICNGVPMPVLGDIRHLKGMDNEAREYLAKDECFELLPAIAILAENPFQFIIYKFFFTFINKENKVPTKLFRNKEKALLWLGAFRSSN